MPIGEKTEVGFELLPLSVRIEKGHALRIAIAGHDEDSFDRIPARGDQIYDIYRHFGALSYVDLPVRATQNRTAKNEVIDPFYWFRTV